MFSKALIFRPESSRKQVTEDEAYFWSVVTAIGSATIPTTRILVHVFCNNSFDTFMEKRQCLLAVIFDGGCRNQSVDAFLMSFKDGENIPRRPSGRRAVPVSRVSLSTSGLGRGPQHQGQQPSLSKGPPWFGRLSTTSSRSTLTK